MLCDTTRPFVELSAGETPVPNFHQYGATANGELVFVLLEHRSISGMCRAEHYVAETGLNAAHSCQNNSKALALVVTSCASLLIKHNTSTRSSFGAFWEPAQDGIRWLD